MAVPDSAAAADAGGQASDEPGQLGEAPEPVPPADIDRGQGGSTPDHDPRVGTAPQSDGDCDAAPNTAGRGCVEGVPGPPIFYFPFDEPSEPLEPISLPVAPSTPGPLPGHDRHGARAAAYEFSAESCDILSNSDHPSPVAVSTELTVSVWVRATDSSEPQKVLGRAHKAEGEYRGWVIGVYEGHLFPEIWDVVGKRHTFVQGYVASETWTHLAVTWKTGGQMRGFVNGQLVAEVDASSQPIGDATEARFRIGARPWSSVDWCFDGGIDDIRIYDRALTTSEITALAR